MLERSSTQGEWTNQRLVGREYNYLRGKVVGSYFRFRFHFQRALAAAFAMAERRPLDSALARAGPPFLPPMEPRIAAAWLRSSSAFDVPVRRATASRAARFSSSGGLLERLGMLNSLWSSRQTVKCLGGLCPFPWHETEEPLGILRDRSRKDAEPLVDILVLGRDQQFLPKRIVAHSKIDEVLNVRLVEQ